MWNAIELTNREKQALNFFKVYIELKVFDVMERPE